ncbi:MAG: hypothetical protein ACXVB2_22190, partial [Isosphaeraceae bacterium]
GSTAERGPVLPSRRPRPTRQHPDRRGLVERPPPRFVARRAADHQKVRPAPSQHDPDEPATRAPQRHIADRPARLLKRLDERHDLTPILRRRTLRPRHDALDSPQLCHHSLPRLLVQVVSLKSQESLPYTPGTG